MKIAVILCALVITGESLGQGWTFVKEKGNLAGYTAGAAKILFKDVKKQEVDQGDTVTTETTYDIVSAVGPYLTVLKSDYSFITGAAHPDDERVFVVLDAGTGKQVKITDLFPEQDVFKALMADTYVQGAITEGYKPQNLHDLIGHLENTDVARFGDYMLGSFAFYRVEPGKVAMRMGLAYSYGAARGAFTQLGFFLPIPEKLKAHLDVAVKSKTLMKDLRPKIPQF